MSTVSICDGCGKQTRDVNKVGRVLVRDYCAACETRAAAFAEAEDGLRKRLVDQFKTDRGLLVSAASEGGFKLPDVPDAG